MVLPSLRSLIGDVFLPQTINGGHYIVLGCLRSLLEMLECVGVLVKEEFLCAFTPMGYLLGSFFKKNREKPRPLYEMMA
jgi:hypothetical protein